MKRFSRAYLYLILLFMVSCVDLEICDDDSQSYLAGRMRTVYEEEIRDTTLSAFSMYGIREGRADSLIYDSVQISSLVVPLDPHGDISRFVLSAGDVTDTLTVKHRSEAYLISYDCGFAARFTLESFEWGGSLIRDVEIQNETVDAEILVDEAHIWIFF